MWLRPRRRRAAVLQERPQSGDPVQLSGRADRPHRMASLPAGVTFYANRMVARGGLLYFVDLAASRVAVTDSAASACSMSISRS